MENPVERGLDLGLVNYTRHPENPDYVVYRFVDPARAESFEAALVAESIWFEKGEESKRNRLYYLFGIHKNDYKRATRINFLVEAKHKRKLIPGRYLRIFMILFSMSVIVLALVSYCQFHSRLDKLNRVNNTEVSSPNATQTP